MAALTLNHFLRRPLILLGVGEIFVLYSSIYVAGLILYGSIDICEAALGPLGPRALILTVVMMACLVSMGLYHFQQRIYFHEAIVRLCVGFLIGSLVLAVIFFALPAVEASWPLSVIAVGYALTLLLLIRYMFMRRIDENVFRRRILIYGAGQRASALRDLRRKADRRGFKVVGSVPAPGDKLADETNGLLIRDKSVDYLAHELDADEIVVAMDDRRGNLPVRELLRAKLQGVNVIDLVRFLERETGKIRIDLVNPGWLIFSEGFRASRFRKFNKRAMDLVVSFSLLLLAWPIMLMVAACVKIEDGLTAPVLYRQRRVGFRGDVFDVLKFRSMIQNAEADGKAVWAEEGDLRITRVGSYLRKYRLDELPQVLNVILGQMSIVGPRPERPQFVEQLSENIPYYSERHTVKPGVTGWAQLRYSYGSTEEDAVEKLQYDLYYVKNHNVILDLIIILQTVEVVIWGKGAR